MKEPEHDAQKIKSSILKKKLKALIVSIDESDVIRLHRAISWVKCAEDQENNTDLKFITLWIAFNACYADNDAIEYTLSEKKRFKDFIERLVKSDKEERFFKLLWFKFSSSCIVSYPPPR